MQIFDANHEPGEKYLLNVAVVPAGKPGMEDFKVAIDELFNHLNVGLFIGKQLIQRLVTSNPSADYVERIFALDFRFICTSINDDLESRDGGTKIGP